MALPIDFWIDLYEKYPEIFEVIERNGRNILRIISGKFKQSFLKIKEYLSSRKLDNLLPLLDATETHKYLDLQEISLDQKYSTLKKYMTEADWSMFILGRKALEYKQAGNLLAIKDAKHSAIQQQGTRGLMIINFVLQGYFEEIIIPLLGYQIKELRSDSEVLNWFNKFLDKSVKFFPRAFWVSNSTNPFDIQRNLIQRCVSNEFKNVNIHAIGKDNIEKVKSVLKKLSEDSDFPKFDYKENEDVKGVNAITFSIKVL